MKLKINKHLESGIALKTSQNGVQIIEHIYDSDSIVHINSLSSNYDDNYVNGNEFHLTKNIAENSNLSSLSTALYLSLLKEVYFSSKDFSNILAFIKLLTTLPIIIFALMGLIFQSLNFIVISGLLYFICILAEQRSKFSYFRIRKSTISDFIRQHHLVMSSHEIQHLQRLVDLKKKYAFFMSIFNPLLVNMYYFKIGTY